MSEKLKGYYWGRRKFADAEWEPIEIYVRKSFFKMPYQEDEEKPRIVDLDSIYESFGYIIGSDEEFKVKDFEIGPKLEPPFPETLKDSQLNGFKEMMKHTNQSLNKAYKQIRRLKLEIIKLERKNGGS